MKEFKTFNRVREAVRNVKGLLLIVGPKEKIGWPLF
jgi:hypothetical protein